MKLGQTAPVAAAAYNGYTWPANAGTAGQQLETNGSGTLTWADSDGIDWTAKGQLIVGTGAGTDTLLNVGADGTILIADSTAASGLSYTNKYVATLGPTSAALMPAGSTAAQPALTAGQAGAMRYNSNTVAMEFWNGTAWETVASSGSNGFVEQTSATGSALMPTGNSLQRDTAPAVGYTRFNTTNVNLEVWDGTYWTPASPVATAGLGLNLSGLSSNRFFKLSTPIQFGPPAAGVLSTEAIDGSLYWDNTLGLMFVRYNDGSSTQWVQVIPS
jgi:hypothetical protein